MFKDFLFAVLATFGLSKALDSQKTQQSYPPQPQANVTLPFSNADLDALARTLWGEARGEGYKGMQAVANVIMNRYRQAQKSVSKARQFGATVYDIVTKPYQFSVWLANDPNYAKIMSVDESDTRFILAKDIAFEALSNNLPDITNGADHYHTAAVSPNWSKGQTPVAVIGSHKFFDLA